MCDFLRDGCPPSQSRFITTEQYKMQQELSTFEERKALKDWEEAEETQASSRENKQLLADTLHQLLQPAQPALQPAFKIKFKKSITTNHCREFSVYDSIVSSVQYDAHTKPSRWPCKTNSLIHNLDSSDTFDV